VEASLHEQLVAALKHRLPRRHQLRAAAALEREDDEAGRAADPAFREALADEDRVVRDAHLEIARLQAVLLTQRALAAALGLLLGLSPRQKMAADERDEDDAGDHQRAADRHEVEDAERLESGARQRVGDEQVRRGSDERRETAEQRAVSQGNEQPRDRKST